MIDLKVNKVMENGEWVNGDYFQWRIVKVATGLYGKTPTIVGETCMGLVNGYSGECIWACNQSGEVFTVDYLQIGEKVFNGREPGEYKYAGMKIPREEGDCGRVVRALLFLQALQEKAMKAIEDRWSPAMALEIGSLNL